MEKLNKFERLKEQLKLDVEKSLINRKKGILDYDEESRLCRAFFDNIWGIYHFGFISYSEYVQLSDLIYEAFGFEFRVRKTC